MRVPTQDSPSVQSRGLEGAQPAMRQADTSLARGLQQVGAGVQDLGEGIQHARNAELARADEAQRQADALVNANAQTQFERTITDHLQGRSEGTDLRPDGKLADSERVPGYLQTRGLDASGQSAATLESIEKARQKIRDSLPMQHQRDRFEAQSQGTYEGVRRTVEGHAGSEFHRAKADALEGLKEETLRAVFYEPDSAGVGQKYAQVSTLIDELGLSPEGKEGLAAQWRQKFVAQQIAGQLAQGNVAGAEQRFQIQRANLGDKADDIAEAIRRARAGQQKDEQNKFVANAVDDITTAARRPDGYVDRARAIELFAKLPADKGKEVESLLNSRLELEENRKKADIDTMKRQARGLFNKGGMLAIPGTLFEKLNHYDPDYLGRLQNEQASEDRTRAIMARGTRGEKSALAKEQAENLKVAVETMNATPTDDRAGVDVDAMLRELDLSPADLPRHGVPHLEAMKTKAKELSDKGFSRDADADQAVADNAAADLFKPHGKKPALYGEEQRKAYISEFSSEWQRLAKEKGRAPTRAETDEVIAKLKGDVTRKKPGRIWDSTEKVPFFLDAAEKHGDLVDDPKTGKPRFIGKVRTPTTEKPASTEQLQPGMKWQINKVTGARRQIPK